MGQFSWMYCNTNNTRAMKDGKTVNSYLLVPEEFQAEYGTAIKETCYNGYGDMGGYDVYDLVMIWNKKFIPEIIEQRTTKGDHLDTKNLMAFYNDEPIDVPLRYLGVDLACYDEENASLPYPIKISSSAGVDYEDMPASKGDPNQGW